MLLGRFRPFFWIFGSYRMFVRSVLEGSTPAKHVRGSMLEMSESESFRLSYHSRAGTSRYPPVIQTERQHFVHKVRTCRFAAACTFQGISLEAPDLEDLQAGIDGHSIKRTMSNVNFQCQIRRGIDIQIELLLASHLGLVLNPIAFVSLQAFLPPFQPQDG